MADGLEIAQQAIVTAMSQHASWLYRASTASANRLNAEIDKLAADLAAMLGDQLDALSHAELQAFAAGKYTTSRLKQLRAEIEAWAQALNEAVMAEWLATAPDLAGYEADYALGVMNQALEDLPAVSITATAIYKAAMAQPVLGELVDSLLSGISEGTKTRVYARIRQGVAAGETNRDIVRALRGTPALNFKDGLLEVTRRDAETVVRTARNHIGNVAYDEIYRELGVAYVMDCATLDGRTSKFCASIDGRKHKVGTNHPRPPYHPRCRTVQVPVIAEGLMGNRPYVRAMKVQGRDGKWKYRSIGNMTKAQRERAGLQVGQVKATTTYTSWFANQSAAYQREWLGPSRYELYKTGKYPLDRFVDPTGREYSLEELRARDEATFREVFGD